MNRLIEEARNVVFDVGQVLLSFEPEKILPIMLTEDEQKVLKIPPLFETKMWAELDRGVITDEEEAHYAARLAGDESLWPAVLRVTRGCYEHMDVLPAANLIPILKAQGKGVYILSNYNDKTFTRTRERFADVFKDVDGMIVSGFEHVLKPDPAIYHLLLDRYCLKAEECVFIDDRDVNIEAARAVGMKGIVYTGPEALK